MATKQKLKGFSPTRRYKNDSAAVSGGVWRDYADGAARLLVARYQNPEHEAFIRAEREKHPEFTEGGEKADTAEAKAFFLEWSALEFVNGINIDGTPQEAISNKVDPALEIIRLATPAAFFIASEFKYANGM